MKVSVVFFARARELAGTGSLRVDLPGGVTVAGLREELARRMPGVAVFLPQCAVAVNGEFASEGRVLAAGDEAAILPPVSGG